MKKFRLPRKIKKKLSGRIFLYQPEDDGSRMVAFPKDNQVDYTAVKRGVATDMFHRTKKQRKADNEVWEKTYHTPIEVGLTELFYMVNDVFAIEYRDKAYKMLVEASTNEDAINDYYTFINAYNLGKTNICAMCYDGLEHSLKKKHI